VAVILKLVLFPSHIVWATGCPVIEGTLYSSIYHPEPVRRGINIPWFVVFTSSIAELSAGVPVVFMAAPCPLAGSCRRQFKVMSTANNNIFCRIMILF